MADDETRSIDVGDMNNDGYLDIVSGNLRAENKLYYGNEKMDFSQSISFSANRPTSTVAVADLNGDGYLDIVEGNFEDRNYVYFGSEAGAFEEVGLREDLKDDTYDIEIGDIDNNGLLDIVISNSGELNLFYKTRSESR